MSYTKESIFQMMMRVTPTKTIAPEIPNPIFSESTGFWWQSEREKIKKK